MSLYAESDKPESIPSVKEILSNIVQKIFAQDISELDKRLTKSPENLVLSSLPLQVVIFFNAIFYPFWLASTMLMLVLKYNYLTTELQVVVLAAVVIFSFIEIIRLYLGYVGNITEKIPELAGFLLLTILPQAPLILVLLFFDSLIIMPLEYAVHSILVVMIVFQVIFALPTVKNIARRQATKSHLQQFVDLGRINEEETDDYPSSIVKTHSRRRTTAGGGHIEEVDGAF